MPVHGVAVPARFVWCLGVAHVFVAVCANGDPASDTCSEALRCSLGALREEIETFGHEQPGSDSRSIVNALRRHKRHGSCPDPIADYAETNLSPSPETAHGYQCDSHFTFTSAEGFIGKCAPQSRAVGPIALANALRTATGHCLLIINVALGTLWLDRSRLYAEGAVTASVDGDLLLPEETKV